MKYLVAADLSIGFDDVVLDEPCSELVVRPGVPDVGVGVVKVVLHHSDVLVALFLRLGADEVVSNEPVVL